MQIDSTTSQTISTNNGTATFKSRQSKHLMPGFTPVKPVSPTRISTKSPSSRQTHFYQRFNTQRVSLNKKLYKPQLRPIEKEDPLERIRKKINTVFLEYNDKMVGIGMQCSQLDVELENQFSQIQDEYIEEVDQMYLEKVNRMKEVNEKYDYEIYKIENKEKELCEEMKKKKEEELKDIEMEFNNKRNKIVEVYKGKVDIVKESHVRKKQEFLMGSKVISDMKDSINKILNVPIEIDEDGKVILSNI